MEQVDYYNEQGFRVLILTIPELNSDEVKHSLFVADENGTMFRLSRRI